MTYYKIQYHKKDEHSDNWYDREGYNKYNIMFVNEEPIYTTWQFPAQSSR